MQARSLRSGAHFEKFDVAAAGTVLVFTLDGQTPFSAKPLAARGTEVDHFLPRLISLDRVAVVDLGIKSKIFHGLPPSRTVTSTVLAPVPAKCEQVGVFVAQGEFEAITVVEQMTTQRNHPSVEIGGAGGRAKVTPFEPRLLAKRKFMTEPLEEPLGLMVQIVSNHQNPGIPIMPPPPMSLAMSNHLRVSYLAQMSPTSPSVAPPALSMVSLVPFMA